MGKFISRSNYLLSLIFLSVVEVPIIPVIGKKIAVTSSRGPSCSGSRVVLVTDVIKPDASH